MNNFKVIDIGMSECFQMKNLIKSSKNIFKKFFCETDQPESMQYHREKFGDAPLKSAFEGVDLNKIAKVWAKSYQFKKIHSRRLFYLFQIFNYFNPNKSCRQDLVII